MNPVISRFCRFYNEFDLTSLVDVARVYSNDVVFEDPAHRLVGLEEMTRYFEALLSNTSQCSFVIEQIVVQDNHAFVSWDMTLSHPKLKTGQLINVPGASHLQFSEYVQYHRDYFDLGKMLYEQLPLLGTVIRRIKSRLAA